MKTVVLGPRPAELEQLIARRHEHGLDLFDEEWEGVYHVAPAPRFRHALLDAEVARVIGPLAEAAGLAGSGPFNLGAPHDYRVPDRGYHQGRPQPDAVYLPTVAIAVEILSPDDETYEKLPFYAAHGVGEVLVVDPDEQRVRFLVSTGDAYEERDVSPLLGVAAGEVEAAIRWH